MERRDPDAGAPEQAEGSFTDAIWRVGAAAQRVAPAAPRRFTEALWELHGDRRGTGLSQQRLSRAERGGSAAFDRPGRPGPGGRTIICKTLIVVEQKGLSFWHNMVYTE